MVTKKRGVIVAIDGPAGVGKSTVSRIIAERCGYLYINTGVMYRAVAWYAIRKHIDFNLEAELTEIAGKISIRFVIENKRQKIYIDNIDAASDLQGEEISSGASTISKIEGVRDTLSILQKKMGEQGNIVMEGRDIGTVIFPDADIKFFLSASIEERAKRRYNELKKRDKYTNFAMIIENIRQRDNDDSGRAIAPLKKADNAIEIDTTQLSIDEVVNFMIQKIEEKIS